jgi:hypothetical protein
LVVPDVAGFVHLVDLDTRIVVLHSSVESDPVFAGDTYYLEVRAQDLRFEQIAALSHQSLTMCTLRWKLQTVATLVKFPHRVHFDVALVRGTVVASHIAVGKGSIAVPPRIAVEMAGIAEVMGDIVVVQHIAEGTEDIAVALHIDVEKVDTTVEEHIAVQALNAVP